MLLSVLSCASSPPQPPAWVLDAEVVYPAEAYIAQPGRGSDRRMAELAGIQAISRWFASEVKSSVSAGRSYSEQDGAASQSTQVDEQVFVQSQTQLFAVRYTEAWYNERASEGEVLAYIDRAEAWAIYEPALRQKADAFRSLYRAAEADAESIKQFYLYQAARAIAPELEQMLGFASVLYPGRAAAFHGVRDTIAELPQKTDSARTNADIYIDCPADQERTLYAALARVFGGLGFPIRQDSEAASAVCATRINENMQQLEAGTFYAPGITLSLTGKTGPLFTWNAAAQRTGAFNTEIARNRAYAALAREIEKKPRGGICPREE
ncbi:MAG: hypothetical protein LBL20_06965 [Treponema sp.]|nr:hypothetical protein [Treponema sp.]